MSSHGLDMNTLSWVKSEIDETLNQARIALESYVENTDDESKLRFCINYLHQINGTLQMVELFGASLAIEEMEALAKAVQTGDVSNKDDAYEALMRGILQVPDYLEHLMAGHRDMPVILLPLLNDLRAARGEALLSESALFTPDLEVPAPVSEPSLEVVAPHVEEGITALARKLRHNYHLGLLGWFRDKDPQNSLQRITNILEQLYSASTNEEVRRLMWIASGLAESLKDGGLETSVSVKLLLGQVDRQIKKIIDLGESALDSEKPVELEKNLLFYVASSNATNERTQELKQAFNLKSILPDSQTLEQTRADLSGPNAALLHTVSSVIMEDLNKVKDTLDVFVRSDDRDLTVLGGLRSTLVQMGDTLAMLGLGIQRQAVLKQAELLDAMASGKSDASESNLMAVAAAMLAVESSLTEISTARAVNEEMQAVSTEGMDAGEIAIEQLQEAERRKLMQTVLNEAGNDINRIKDAISDYSRDTSKHDLLEQVPDSIERVRGSLLILNLERAAELLGTCNSYIQSVLIDSKQIPDQFSFNALADAISSVEYYIESLTGNWGQPEAILDVAEQSLKMLNFEMPPAKKTAAIEELDLSDDDMLTVEELPEADAGDNSLELQNIDSELTLDDFQFETDITDIADNQFDTESSFSLEDITTELSDVADGLQDTDQALELTLDDVESDDAFDLGDNEFSLDFDLDIGSELDLGLEDELPAQTSKLAITPQTDITPERLQEVVEFWFFDSTPDCEYIPVLQEMLAQLAAFSEGYQNNAALKAIDDLQEMIEKIVAGQTTLAEQAELVYSLRDRIIAELWPDSVPQAAIADPLPEPVVQQAVIQEEPVEKAVVQHEVDEAIDDEIIEIFLEEAQEAYETITNLLPQWEANHQDTESLKELRRAFHTLKGSGRLVGAMDVGEFSWAYENMLNRVLDNSIEASTDLFSILNSGTQALPELFDLFRTHGKPGQHILRLMNHADALSQGKPLTIETLDESQQAVAPASEQAITLPEEAKPAVSGIPAPTIDGVLQEIYTKEVATHIATLNEYIDNWHRGEHEATYALLRALHTLTGSSRTTGVSNIAVACGKFEDYVKKLQKNEQPFAEPAVSVLENTIVLIEQTMEQITLPGGGYLPDQSLLYAEISKLIDSVKEKQQEEEPVVSFHQPVPEPIVTSPVTPTPAPVQRAAQQIEVPTEALADVDEELLEIFLEEGTEILDECDQTLQEWSTNPNDPRLLEALQRHLHTLKGGARMAGIRTIGDLGHSIESMLTSVVDGHIGVSRAMFELLQRSQDRLVKMLEQAQARMMPVAANDLLAELESLAERGSLDIPADVETTVVPPVVAPSQDEIKARAKIELPQEEQQNRPAEKVTVVETPVETMPSQVEAPPVVQAPVADTPDRSVAATDNVVPLQAETRVPVETTDLPEEVADDDMQQDRRRGPRIQQEQIRVRSDLLDNLVNFAGEVSIYRSRLEQQTNSFRFNLHELEDTVVRLRQQLRQFEIETEAQIQYRREETIGTAHEDFDPLEFDRFTTMQHLSRAMLESLSDLDSLRGILHNLTREQETLLLQQSRVNTELQEGLMRTRMVPFSGQAARLRRIVRQTSSELGKSAELHLFGVEEELDRNILDRVIPPIEHMLRNAVAHGIELPAARRQAGKGDTGQINLNISREGSEIKITISDDGAGINLEAIHRKAVEKGLLPPGVQPHKDILIDMMMQSGFSTAETISQIAGRGVGMDVVNTEIKQLGGVLEIDTSKGKGTTFNINLPLTLAITRALMITVGEETFAVPLLSVEGVERIDHDDLVKLVNSDDQTYSWLNHEYNFMHLGSVMGLSQLNVTDMDRKMPLLMVRSGEYRAAILVDGLLGSREIVVKPVGAQLSTLRGISGATIMGDGSVVLIVDLSVLLRLAGAADESEVIEITEVPVKKARPLVMVVDDSITVRKVTTRLLERNEMDVISAKDGVDALAQLQEQIPDVMLLDVEMPRMDGFELATNVRNNDATRHIPIIMITSRTGQKHRDRAAAIGVNIYMGKPYTETDLMSNIESLIGDI